MYTLNAYKTMEARNSQNTRLD